MKLRLLNILLSFSLIIIFHSCKDDIIVQSQCTENPSVDYRRAKITLHTDVVSEVNVNIDRIGYFSGENFIIEKNGIRKSANMSGYFCKNRSFYINVTYNDTANTSKLRIEGDPPDGSFFSAKILYSPNTPNEPGYTIIGGFGGTITLGGIGGGEFETPLFSGFFDCELYRE